MKTNQMLLAFGTALLFGAAAAFAQSAVGTSATTASSTTTSVTGTGATSGGSTRATASTTATGSAGAATGQNATSAVGAANAGVHAQSSVHDHVPNPNASAYAAAVQTILAKYDANRDQYISERQALVAQLQAAKTDTERQAVIAQLRAEGQAEASARVQMAKEIRGDLKALRLQRQNGGS